MFACACERAREHEQPLEESLRSGVLLCNLVNKLKVVIFLSQFLCHLSVAVPVIFLSPALSHLSVSVPVACLPVLLSFLSPCFARALLLPSSTLMHVCICAHVRVYYSPVPYQKYRNRQCLFLCARTSNPSATLVAPWGMFNSVRVYMHKYTHPHKRKLVRGLTHLSHTIAHTHVCAGYQTETTSRQMICSSNET